MRANRAEELLEHAAETLRAQGLDDIRIAGDLRRGCEVIADLRLVGASPSRMGHARVGAVGVNIVPPDKLGGALLYATGSERHVEQLEALARKKNLRSARTVLANSAVP
jgi:DNA polymerase (family 10)